jgi:hypothetical protein
MLNRTAPTLPKEALPQLLADPRWFIGALANQHWAQERNCSLDQRLAGHGAAEANLAFVGQDLDDRIDVVLGLELVRPSSCDGATAETSDSDASDLHVRITRLLLAEKTGHGFYVGHGPRTSILMSMLS